VIKRNSFSAIKSAGVRTRNKQMLLICVVRTENFIHSFNYSNVVIELGMGKSSKKKPKTKKERAEKRKKRKEKRSKK